MVELIWLGHACFLLKGNTKTIIIDPFKITGLPEPRVKADIILCTHKHFDHANITPVRQKASIVLEEFVGSKNVDGIGIKGIATFHDDSKGRHRGHNSVYTITFTGLSFCHLGDLGHDLTEHQITEIGEIDVLMIPIGGFFTIDGTTAINIMQKIRSRITIPMHYRVRGMPPKLNVLSDITSFLANARKRNVNVITLNTSNLSVQKRTLPPEKTIIIPRPKLL